MIEVHITILKVVLEIKSLKHDDKQVTFLKMKANEFFLKHQLKVENIRLFCNLMKKKFMEKLKRKLKKS